MKYFASRPRSSTITISKTKKKGKRKGIFNFKDAAHSSSSFLDFTLSGSRFYVSNLQLFSMQEVYIKIERKSLAQALPNE